MDKRVLPNDILLGEVTALLREGRDAVIIPKGSSMLPTIRGDRDRVTLHRQEEVRDGDIVLVHTGGRYILHRVIAVDGDALTLMGDGNLQGTEHCTTQDVCGTVIEIQRPGGRARKPGPGRFWRAIKPLRRYILGIYRRLI